MRCENKGDLKDLIIKSELYPLGQRVKLGEVTKEEYQRQWVSTDDKAIELWDKLIEKNNKLYAKYGYLDIEYVESKNIYRRQPMKRGQPTKEVKKDIKVSIKLDAKEMKLLENYCTKKNITKSKAIRELINGLKYK